MYVAKLKMNDETGLVNKVNRMNKYKRRKYLSQQRIITHWHQANEVANSCEIGSNILEIGPGSGHTSWLLKSWGYNITTLDIDDSTKPDINARVTGIPVKDKQFDCVLAAEILEHLPFEQFGLALLELKRVSRKSIIITLPAPFIGVSGLINLPRQSLKSFFLGIPYFFSKHKYDGEHYWELGKWGSGFNCIRRIIHKNDLEIKREFRPAPSLYCYFFILNRK